MSSRDKGPGALCAVIVAGRTFVGRRPPRWRVRVGLRDAIEVHSVTDSRGNLLYLGVPLGQIRFRRCIAVVDVTPGSLLHQTYVKVETGVSVSKDVPTRPRAV